MPQTRRIYLFLDSNDSWRVRNRCGDADKKQVTTFLQESEFVNGSPKGRGAVEYGLAQKSTIKEA